MKNTEIIDFLSTDYSNLGEISKIKKIKHNNINSQNYFISAKKGNFVLRKFSNRYTSEDIKKICTVLTFCSKYKISVPIPILRKNHSFVNSQKKTYLTNFYDGDFFNGSTDQLINLAKSTAKLHKILKKFPICYNLNSKNEYNILSISELNKIKNLIDKYDYPDRHDKTLIKNFDFVNSLLIENSNTKNLFQAKKQLIHYDLHPQNILFLKNSKPVILDFNSIRRGLIIEDVAFASFRFAIFNSTKNSKLESLMKLFISEYLKNNSIENKHLTNLVSYIRIRILALLSYVLREKYFHHSDLWNLYISKHLKTLKILKKLHTIQI